MTEHARFQPQLLHPEQVSPEKEPEKPWFRQANEPAVAFLHFRIYLDLGPHRSLRKALAIDRGLDLSMVGDKGLQEIKIPGSWQRASKVWRWKERAAAFDLREREQKSAILQKVASGAAFCSRSYRILQLDTMATTLQQVLLQPNLPISTYVTVSSRLQSIMRDIASEIAELDVTTTHADVVGLEDLIKSGRLKF